MTMDSTDIEVFYSCTTGPGYSTTQTDANASLGQFLSRTAIPSGVTLHNLFPLATPAQNAAGLVTYRCLFIYNRDTANYLETPLIWLYSTVAGGAEVAIAVDSVASSAYNSASAQALEIVDEEDSTSVLSGLSFSSPTTIETGLSLGTIQNGKVKAFWVRRTLTDSAAVSYDGCTVKIVGRDI